MDTIVSEKSSISYKRILKITLPIILSSFSLNIMLFVDRAFVAKCDLSQFASILPSGIFVSTICLLFSGIIGYTSALISQYYGAQKFKECASSMWQGIYLSVFFAVLLLSLSPFIANLFQILGHTGDLLKYEKQYFYLIMISGCVQLFSTAFSGFYSGIGNTKIPMWVNIMANIVNIILDYLLIFGKFGFPEMGGIMGAGLATVLSNVFAVILFIFLLNTTKEKAQFDLLKNYHFNFPLIRKLLKFGFPAAIQAFFGQASYSALLLIIGISGEFNMSCANIAFTIEGISVFPIYGLASAIGIIAGQERGAGRTPNISKVLYRGILLGFGFNMLIMAVYLIFPDALISIFDSGKDSARFLLVKNATVPLVRFMAIWLAIDTISVLTSSVLRSVGDTVFMMILYIIVPVLFYIPPAYLICVVVQIPMIWLWITLLLFSVCMASIVSRRFYVGKWKKIEVI